MLLITGITGHTGRYFLQELINLTLGKIDYIEKVQRMTENRSFSHEEATLDFGYNPEAFEVGIAREVQEYFKNRK